jgi:anti-sigma B factor antagonist
MGIRVESKIPGVSVVRVEGDLDLYNTRELADCADEAMEKGCLHLIIDFSRLKFIDTSGFSSLITCNRRLKAKHGTLSVFGLDSNTQKLFSRIGADRIFSLYPDEATAMQHIR